MSPFYFGDSAKPLFGIYNPAHPAHDRQKALLICPAGFRDYMRSHRLLKQLAVSLSERGIHVLRFDYAGCGDSAGNSCFAL
jgi:alpha/beta superfamily hydrolase